ncbi:hypothetical protein HYC85_029367 [Camellia sinensis]|uniref:Uncharacterized protein n=1 Tax=Camellia sinensis TaxID=4442 RepID=A0A7J7G1V3_CAMSI|nr:hypothetical protein HYC85_029367 [Camellia sinensis]
MVGPRTFRLSVSFMLWHDCSVFKTYCFWYGTKCCTKLSATVGVTSRVRTSHLLGPYKHELGPRRGGDMSMFHLLHDQIQ